MVLVQGDDTLGKASAKDEQADTTVENAQQTKGGISHRLPFWSQFL